VGRRACAVAVNLVAFPVLWVLTITRAVVHPSDFFKDLVDHQRGVGFFTAVAGTSVLGVQLVLVRGDYGAGFALWVLAVGLWLLLTYAIFTAFTVKDTKPRWRTGSTAAGGDSGRDQSIQPRGRCCPASSATTRSCSSSRWCSGSAAGCSTSG
jgi:hypothetical protein